MEIIHKHFNTIDSTNNWGKSNCHLFDKNQMTIITADTQTSGRGRFKREWVSPPHENIYATFCFALDKGRTDIGNVPQVLSLSALETIRHFGLHAKLKWPNDVLLSDKKVAGILCETVSFQDYFMVILGIGLNVNMSLSSLELIDRPATSLLNETAKTFSVESVLKILEETFVRDFEVFLTQGFKPFLEKYKELIWTSSQQKLRFHDNLNIIEGFFHSINNDGTLNLTLESGEIKRFLSGEFIT